MRRLSHMLRKEFTQLRRDRRLLGPLLFAPVFQLIILGYAANVDVRLIEIAVLDQSRSPRSRELVREVASSGYFEVVAFCERPEEIDRLIELGRAKLGLVVPPEFEQRLRELEEVELQVLADGSDSNAATIGLNYLGQALRRFSAGLGSEALVRAGLREIPAPRITPEIRVWYNPELRSSHYMIPGVLSLLLMVVTMIVTAMALVKEREIGTMEQVIVTPIRPLELILGKLAPFILVGFVNVLLVLGAAMAVFDIPFRGSLALLFLLSGLYLVCTLGLGLFVSTIAQTQHQAMMIATFFVMMPFVLLSGFIFPIESMPRPVQLLTYLIPLRYFLVIVRSLFLKGTGLAELWPQAAALLVWGLAITTLATLRFHKRIG